MVGLSVVGSTVTTVGADGIADCIIGVKNGKSNLSLHVNKFLFEKGSHCTTSKVMQPDLFYFQPMSFTFCTGDIKCSCGNGNSAHDLIVTQQNAVFHVFQIHKCED